ncbi:hypothetical protein SNEBB_011091 [Seison nebaliae]|nr:hypothetical protein SNEBB_011091 [Seison nebaliae]
MSKFLYQYIIKRPLDYFVQCQPVKDRDDLLEEKKVYIEQFQYWPRLVTEKILLHLDWETLNCLDVNSTSLLEDDEFWKKKLFFDLTRMFQFTHQTSPYEMEENINENKKLYKFCYKTYWRDEGDKCGNFLLIGNGLTRSNYSIASKLINVDSLPMNNMLTSKLIKGKSYGITVCFSTNAKTRKERLANVERNFHFRSIESNLNYLSILIDYIRILLTDVSVIHQSVYGSKSLPIYLLNFDVEIHEEIYWFEKEFLNYFLKLYDDRYTYHFPLLICCLYHPNKMLGTTLFNLLRIFNNNRTTQSINELYDLIIKFHENYLTKYRQLKLELIKDEIFINLPDDSKEAYVISKFKQLSPISDENKFTMEKELNQWKNKQINVNLWRNRLWRMRILDITNQNEFEEFIEIYLDGKNSRHVRALSSH